MSRGQPRLRSQSARRILERCKNKGNTEDTIIIDDDTENTDVVLIDNPNTSHQGSSSVNAKTTRSSCSPRGVIFIDDEEGDPRHSSADTTTSNQFAETFCSLSLSEDSDSDEFPMFVQNGNVCCDHTGPSRNRYGLDLDSENSMTENSSLKSNTDACDEFDCSSSDCELMEDQSGFFREQWEKAASKKKESRQFASTDQATTSKSSAHTKDPSHEPKLHDADVVHCFERMPPNYFEEMLAEFGPRESNNAEQCFSANILSTDENGDIPFKTTVNISVTQSCFSSHIPYKESGNWMKDDEPNLEDHTQTVHSMDDGLSFLDMDAQVPVNASFVSHESHDRTRFFDKVEPSIRTTFVSSKLDGKQASKDKDLRRDGVEHKLDEVSFNAQEKHEIVAECEASGFKESKNRDSEDSSSFCSLQHEEPLIKTQTSISDGDMDSKMKNKVDTTDMRLTSHTSDDMPHGYDSLMGERERHKETDEYKRVVEEEWASRQQQLQIQAEEAQRLRKRKKAENMRLLDMEKRQKQRLEEIRNLQKKDEEATQLKERIQAEVRRDLEALEMNCRDMASVLRALGIHVKGGFFPTVHEINAAYKQALLRFHPDRASRTDIRQQVEAEEKFKLISRLKENLLL